MATALAGSVDSRTTWQTLRYPEFGCKLKEEKSSYPVSIERIDHDRLFKQLLETFFVDFMRMFFPQASEAIDFRHVRFLEQEIFTDITGGDHHKIDILVETRLRGESGLILVHVEPQSYVQKDFNQRMFIYFNRLYEKHRQRILPVAVFGHDSIREEPDTFELGFPFLDVVKFRFYALQLKKLNWRDYVNTNNPAAAALMSKMGFPQEERVQLKLEFIRMLTRMELDPAKMQLLAVFFENYVKLTPGEEEALEGELGKLNEKEAKVIMELTTSWHEKGRQEGRLEGRREGLLEGRREGLLEGKREGLLAGRREGLVEGRREGLVEGRLEGCRDTLLRILRRRFGTDSSAMQERLQAITDVDAIIELTDRLIDAENLAEAKRMVDEAAARYPNRSVSSYRKTH